MNNGKTREQVISAFWALFNNNASLTAAGFKSFGRRYKHSADVPSAEKPALIMLESPETHIRGSEAYPQKTILAPNLLIYIDSGNDPNETPSIILNNLMDAVEACAAPPPTDTRQTLNGLVSHCWLEGKADKVPGDLDGDGIAMLPFKILVP